MKLTSSAFSNNSPIPVRYTCDADGINPPLSISGVPAQAESLALIVDDPDAPNGDFVHWVLFHIPPTVTNIEEDSTPDEAISGINSASTVGYTSPCPPSGTHRYFFTLYSLDTQITGDEHMSKQQLLNLMQNHILDTAQLIGTYKKQ